MLGPNWKINMDRKGMPFVTLGSQQRMRPKILDASQVAIPIKNGCFKDRAEQIV